jgi:DNA-binding transcriptional MocR family regulator
VIGTAPTSSQARRLSRSCVDKAERELSAPEHAEGREPGLWEPGGRIPPESQLVDEFGCSRNTVREAIALLVREGLLERRQGEGTFVKMEIDPFPVLLSAEEGWQGSDQPGDTNRSEIEFFGFPSAGAIVQVVHRTAFDATRAIRVTINTFPADRNLPIYEIKDISPAHERRTISAS